MGNLFSWISNLFNKPCSLLMIGLDSGGSIHPKLTNTGKTTILYKMKLEETIQTTPTVGFNVETLNIKNINMTVWDVGVRDKGRPLWRHYFKNSQGLIWVIDS